MSDVITVMVVEDNAEYRAVVNLALDDEQDIELIAEFGTSEIALRELLDSRLAKPNVILLDLRLPGMSGLEALPYFKQYAPGAKIIVLTQSDREGDVLQAIIQGASGYLLKSASVKDILGGIRTVVNGGASLDSGVAQFLLRNLRHRLPKGEVKIELSGRELEILELLSQGFVKKQIADRLRIGYSTVDTHVGHIYQKLQVKNAPAAVDKAYRVGIFPSSRM